MSAVCTVCGRAACCRYHGHVCEIECLTYAVAREKARADAAEAALARVLDVADEEAWNRTMGSASIDFHNGIIPPPVGSAGRTRAEGYIDLAERLRAAAKAEGRRGREGQAMNQCKACPWKKSVKPARDIPGGYSAKKHAALSCTIAEPGSFRGGGSMMACHEFPAGKEKPCVGWLANQLGPGNNIGLRMQALDGRFGDFQTDGPQHERFEDTLPQRGRRRAAQGESP